VISRVPFILDFHLNLNYSYGDTVEYCNNQRSAAMLFSRRSLSLSDACNLNYRQDAPKVPEHRIPLIKHLFSCLSPAPCIYVTVVRHTHSTASGRRKETRAGHQRKRKEKRNEKKFTGHKLRISIASYPLPSTSLHHVYRTDPTIRNLIKQVVTKVSISWK